MNRLFLISVLAVAAFFTFQQTSFAVCGGATPNFFCNDSPPNPDLIGIQQIGNPADLTVIVSEGAEVDTIAAGTNCINTGDGNDTVDVEGADLKCSTVSSNCIEVFGGFNTVNVTDSRIDGDDNVRTGTDPDVVNIVGSELIADDDCVQVSSGDDVVSFTDSTCLALGDAMELAGDNDTVNILRSRIECVQQGGCNAVEASSGNDTVTVVESILLADDTISLGSGNDTLTLGTGADLRPPVGADQDAIITCSTGFDTIIFNMEVPQERLNFYSNQIALATVPDGSVTIDGLFYIWDDCELLVNELVGVRITRPIPTLSQWGLIAMAGIIGLAGLIAIRRKSITA